MVEIITVEEMARAEERCGVPVETLMERAGAACVTSLKRHFGTLSVSVLCGPGNNGGDGFVVARLLKEEGWDVEVFGFAPRTQAAQKAAKRWGGEIQPLTSDSGLGSALVVDALFGSGLSRPLEGVCASVARSLRKKTVFSVDIPSGVEGNTGAVRGEAFFASLTTIFFRARPGHFLLPGRIHCGTRETVSIGIPDSVVSSRLFENTMDLWRGARVPLAVGRHKYSRGSVLVMSGGMDSTGAARLACYGALRVGAGVVTALAPDTDSLKILASSLMSVMTKLCKTVSSLEEFLADKRHTVLLLGPGNGHKDTRERVFLAARTNTNLVLDADAISVFEGEEESLCAALRNRKGISVLTPHEGEFGRVFGGCSGDKVSRAREAARKSGAIVVLKGADTVITDGERAAINGNAPPFLATAGSGDVLAGSVAGFLAQGMPGFEAACGAVWLHGAAGGRLGPSLIAEELPGVMGSVLASL